MDTSFIYSRIPHRPPFLWLDRVLELNGETIRAEKVIPRELDLFAGHYPEYPVMPGVLLCEAVFQAGALLLSERIAEDGGTVAGIPVLTRIHSARFRREVGPGDRIEIRVQLKERLGSAWFLRGTVRVHGAVALQVGFGCALKTG